MKKVFAFLLFMLLAAAPVNGEEGQADPARYYDYEKGLPSCTPVSVEKTREFEHFSFSYPSALQTSYPNNTVYLDFYEPNNEKYPAVIFLSHLAGGTSQIEGEFCRNLAAKGIAVLFVQTAYQKDYKFSKEWLDQNIKQCGTDGLVQLFRQIVIEARRGIDWLEAQPKVEKEKIGIMGLSLGGIMVPIVTAVDGRPCAMAMVLAGGNMGQIFWSSFSTRSFKKCLEEEGVNSAEELEKKLWIIDPLTFAGRCKAKPAIMVNAHFDAAIPRKCTEELWEALDKPQIIWIPSGHFTSLFTMGYAKIKTVQFLYGELVDREKAKRMEPSYYPESPVSSFVVDTGGMIGADIGYLVDGSIDNRYKDATVGLVKRNLFGTAYFAGGEGVWRSAQDDRYRLEKFGGDIILGSRLTEHTHGFLKYTYESAEVYRIPDSSPEDFKRNMGHTGVSTLAFHWERNTFDDDLYPTDGTYYHATYGVASKVLGGDYNFMRAVAEGRWYFTLPYPKITLAFRGKGGWMGTYGEAKDVPFFERFMLGGSDTIRGYKINSIGPKDGGNQPLWGTVMLLGNAEARFPIYKWVNGALFYDVGGNWQHLSRVRIPSELQNGVGAGLRIKTKRAVLCFDMGYPLNKDKQQRKPRFEFGLGLPF
jgi:cephalosporin-C deacetylase-like acetyl esterase